MKLMSISEFLYYLNEKTTSFESLVSEFIVIQICLMPCRSKLQANLQRTETEVSQNSITQAFSSNLTNKFRTKMGWCYVVK